MSARIDACFRGRIGGFTLDVAFALEAGVTALSGPSGSGKTTILRCLAGLDHLPGSLVADGETWQDARTFLPTHRRRLGYVFQGASLLPHLTVAGNLAYAARRARDPADMEAIVARTGIAALLDRSPARLSGGEAQRATIARTLISAPRLLLLDEPLSALDGEAKAELLGYLDDFLPTLGLPVLFVSHDAREAGRLAHRRIRLRGGRIEGEETVGRLPTPPIEDSPIARHAESRSF